MLSGIMWFWLFFGFINCIILYFDEEKYETSFEKDEKHLKDFFDSGGGVVFFYAFAILLGPLVLISMIMGTNK